MALGWMTTGFIRGKSRLFSELISQYTNLATTVFGGQREAHHLALGQMTGQSNRVIMWVFEGTLQVVYTMYCMYRPTYV